MPDADVAQFLQERDEMFKRQQDGLRPGELMLGEPLMVDDEEPEIDYAAAEVDWAAVDELTQQAADGIVDCAQELWQGTPDLAKFREVAARISSNVEGYAEELAYLLHQE